VINKFRKIKIFWFFGTYWCFCSNNLPNNRGNYIRNRPWKEKWANPFWRGGTATIFGEAIERFHLQDSKRHPRRDSPNQFKYQCAFFFLFSRSSSWKDYLCTNNLWN